MSVEVHACPAIVAGYEYRVQIEAEGQLFPVGCDLVSHVRTKTSATDIVTTLSTGNGGLVRLSDTTLELVIPGPATAALPAGSVVADIVRTDLDPDRHLQFTLEIPVLRPVTRGL